MPEISFCCFCGHSLGLKQWEGRLRKFCENCQAPVYENPVPATAVVVADQAEGLIFIKRKVAPKKGCWALPGGFMELLESSEEAALRELHEETGLSGKIDRLLGVETNNSPMYGTVLIVGYLVTKYSGNIRAGDDAEAIAFFQPNMMPDVAFDSHKRFIQTALEYLTGDHTPA